MVSAKNLPQSLRKPLGWWQWWRLKVGDW
jgi:hypothetical protein